MFGGGVEADAHIVGDFLLLECFGKQTQAPAAAV